LGEFSPIGQSFSSSFFLKITEVSPKIWNIFIRKKLWTHFGKNSFGYILVDFFTNSSGRPGRGEP
jgi:hypothetical protein